MTVLGTTGEISFWANKVGIKTRKDLPVDAKLQQLCDLFRKHQIVIGDAETGSGKTVRFGQALLAEMLADVSYLKGVKRKVIQTLPMKNAVRWTAEFIAKEMGTTLGDLVGYSLFQDNKTSDNTKLELRIDQSLANSVRRSGCLPEGIIIIDEAHIRTVSIDILLGLIKEYLPKSPNTKILITSATLNTKKFSEFFDGAPVLKIEGRTFPVRKEVLHLVKREHHSEGAARALRGMIQEFFEGNFKIPTEDGKGLQVATKGTTIVLLPGEKDVKNVASVAEQKLKNVYGTNWKDVSEVLMCYGDMKKEEQDKAKKPLTKKLRIVVGTELLRSSVTVPSTICCIDSLQIKRNIVDKDGVGHLAKVTISKAEADQAAGRPGRENPGVYIAVSGGNNEYENLKPFPTPAFLYQPVTAAILQIAAIHRNLRRFPLMDKPDDTYINAGMSRLVKLGCLTTEETITKIGTGIVNVPLDPEPAKSLLIANELKVLPELVLAVSAYSVKGITFSPRKDAKSMLIPNFVYEALKKKLSDSDFEDGDPSWITKKRPDWEINLSSRDLLSNCDLDFLNLPTWCFKEIWKSFAEGSENDFVACVNAYRAFKQEEFRLRDVLGGKRLNNAIFNWCQLHCLNLKRLRLMEDKIKQVKEALRGFNFRLDCDINTSREFNANNLTKALASGLIDLVCSKENQNASFEGPMGKISVCFSSICDPNAQIIVCGGVEKIDGRRGELKLTQLAAPIKSSWLVEIMPQMNLFNLLKDDRYCPKRDQVVESQEIFFNGRKIDTVPVLVKDKDREAKAFASYFAQQLLPSGY